MEVSGTIRACTEARGHSQQSRDPTPKLRDEPVNVLLPASVLQASTFRRTPDELNKGIDICAPALQLHCTAWKKSKLIKCLIQFSLTTSSWFAILKLQFPLRRPLIIESLRSFWPRRCLIWRHSRGTFPLFAQVCGSMHWKKLFVFVRFS